MLHVKDGATAACKLSGRPGVLTPKIAVGRPELHSRSSVGRPDLLPLNLSLTFENFFHLFWSASTFKIDGFQHYFPPLIRVIVVPESASQAILKGKECL